MNKYKKVFEKYDQLNLLEKAFLRHFCYFPPKPRRNRAQHQFKPLNHYQKVYENAFGEDLWKKIANKKVLDFGCGDGCFVLGMANKVPNADILGVDLLPHIELGQNYALSNKINNASFYKGHSKNLPSDTYDVIISHDSFEHFEYPDYILSEMHRLLKKNGLLLIKFGPTWMGPYGRHMSGTIRKDRPWCHLLFPESTIMRVHSVYHNKKELHTEYRNLEGGLNRMTIKKFENLIRQSEFSLKTLKVHPLYNQKWLTAMPIPIIKELFSIALSAVLIKK